MADDFCPCVQMLIDTQSIYYATTENFVQSWSEKNNDKSPPRII
jgi:hypothetical protein